MQLYDCPLAPGPGVLHGAVQHAADHRRGAVGGAGPQLAGAATQGACLGADRRSGAPAGGCRQPGRHRRTAQALGDTVLAARGSIAESRWAGIVESSLILGSDAAQCDLCLPDSRIRPQHAVLAVRGEALLVQPLGPDTTVFVNGEKIAGEHCLQNNDTLRLGRTTIRLVL
ncbi:MAG: FHA domain-containing protein [Subdoligranulum sp.]|nr:FHA domain-containing protein [Subdoligranulum sp.]